MQLDAGPEEKESWPEGWETLESFGEWLDKQVFLDGRESDISCRMDRWELANIRLNLCQMREDAERYRVLRDGLDELPDDVSVYKLIYEGETAVGIELKSGAELDAAVDSVKRMPTSKIIVRPDGSKVFPVAGLAGCWGAMLADGEAITNPLGKTNGPMENWYWKTPEEAAAALEASELAAELDPMGETPSEQVQRKADLWDEALKIGEELFRGEGKHAGLIADCECSVRDGLLCLSDELISEKAKLEHEIGQGWRDVASAEHDRVMRLEHMVIDLENYGTQLRNAASDLLQYLDAHKDNNDEYCLHVRGNLVAAHVAEQRLRNAMAPIESSS